MAGTKKFNVDADIKGKVKITTVPNSQGTVLTYNQVSGEVSTRTNPEIKSDLGLQNNLNVDGTGSKFPTVDAVNAKLVTKQNIPTGFISGLQLSINASDSTKFDIAPGVYIVTDYSNLSDIQPKIVNYPGATAISPTYLATANASYIKIDFNGNIVQTATPFTNQDRRTYAILGAVVHSNHTNINVVNELKAPLIAPTNQLHDFMSAVSRINKNGNVYSANGANLHLNKSAGVIFGLGINPHDYTNPHELGFSAQTSLTFRYRTQNGTEGTDTTDINPNVYDVNGVITTIPGGNNRWTVIRINMFPSGLTRVQPGQAWYNTFNEAVAGYINEPFVTEANIADNAVFRSYLIVKKGITDLAASIAAGESRFIPVNKFGDPVSGGSIAMTYDAIISALGFTPENVANKQNSLAVDGTGQKYPTVDAVNSSLSNVFRNNRILSNEIATVSTTLDAELPNGGFITSYYDSAWGGSDRPNGASYGGYIKFKRTDDNVNLDLYYNNGHDGTLPRLWYRTKEAVNGIRPWMEFWTTNNFNPSNYHNIDLADSINNGSDTRTNKSWFDYNWAGTGNAGSVINFSGHPSKGYSVELYANYINTNLIGIRTHNGDTNTWNTPKYLFHSGNFNPGDYVPVDGNTVIRGIKRFTGDYTQWALNDDGINNANGFAQSLSTLFRIGTLNNKDFAIYRNATEKIFVEDLKTTFNQNIQAGTYVASSDMALGNKVNALRINRQAEDIMGVLSESNGWASIMANGYKKANSDDNYILLGGGGHRPTSDFALSSQLGNYHNIDSSGAIGDGSDIRRNKTWFDYSWAGISGLSGSVINFSGLGGNYSTELFSDYLTGNTIGIRTHNGDSANVWNPVRLLWHNGNFNPSNYVTINTPQTIIADKNFAQTSIVTIYGDESNSTQSYNKSSGVGNIASGWLSNFYGNVWKYGISRGGGSNSDNVKFGFDFSSDGGTIYNRIFSIDATYGNLELKLGGTIDGRANVYLKQDTVGLNATGLWWFDNAQVNRTAGIGTFTQDGLVQYMYMGWSNAPWDPYTSLSVSDSFLKYKNNNVALENWVSTNYIPKTHPVYNISQFYIDQWTTYWGYVDDRQISPSEIPTQRLQFGFGAWGNDLGTTTEWADFVHFGGYQDTSGGNQNLIMFRKDAFGLRQYQGSSQGVSPYSSYVDYWNTGNLPNPASLTDLNNYVTITTPQEIESRKIFRPGTGNSYDTASLELRGSNVSSIYPTLSFHVPGSYAATLSFRPNGFNFMNDLGTILTDVNAAKFIKGGSSDLFILTGGGGHKAISDFVDLTTNGQPITGRKVFNTIGGATGSYIDNALWVYGVSGNNAAMTFQKDGVDTGQIAYTGFVFKFLNNNGSAHIPIISGSFIKDGGTSSQFLKADGSVDSNTYLTTTDLSNYVTINTVQTIQEDKDFSSTSDVRFLGNDQNNILVHKNSTGFGGDLVSGHEYTHYNTRWMIGNVRGSGSDSTEFGIQFSSDNGATYSHRMSVSASNGQINTANTGNSAEWNSIYQNGMLKGNVGLSTYEVYQELDSASSPFNIDDVNVQNYNIVYDDTLNGSVVIYTLINSQIYKLTNMSTTGLLRLDVDGYGNVDVISPGESRTYMAWGSGKLARYNPDGTITQMI